MKADWDIIFEIDLETPVLTKIELSLFFLPSTTATIVSIVPKSEIHGFCHYLDATIQTQTPNVWAYQSEHAGG